MRDAINTFLVRVTGAGLTLGLQVLLARFMPPDQYGSYVIIWTWLLALGSFASLGLGESAVRFLPRYETRGRHKTAAAFFGFGSRAAVTAACLSTGFGLVALQVLPAQDTLLLTGTFIAAALPFMALEYFFEGAARSLGWFKLTSVVVFIVRPLAIAAACLALAAAGIPLTASAVAIILIAVLAASSAYFFVMLRRALPQGAGPTARQRRFWLGATLPMLVVSGLEDIVAAADVLLVGALLSVADAGYYFVALRILALAQFAQYAVQFVQGRRFSIALAAQNRVAVEHSIQEATRLTVLATLGALAVMLALGPVLLSLFGAGFTEAYGPMVILSLGLVARAFSVQASELMLMGGKFRALAVTNIVSLLVLAAGMALLAPRYGLTGAAAAAALFHGLRAIGLAVAAKSSLGVSVVPNFRKLGTATQSG